MDEPDPARRLLDALVADLAPARPLALWPGMALAVVGTVAAAAALTLAAPLRPDLLAGHPAAFVVVRSGLLLCGGMLLTGASLALARPGHETPRLVAGGLLALIVLPLTAVGGLAGLGGGDEMLGVAGEELPGAWHCLTLALAATALVFPALVWGLRRGAVTDPTRAGWTGGAAAGALGTFAYSLGCPSTHWLFAGLVYSAAVVLAAALGRLVIPPLVRW